MKNILITAVTIFLFSNMMIAGEGEKYGKEISLSEKSTIEEILANPEKFEGNKVLVEGEISGVCEKMGCWIELTDGENILKFKVKDGEIVFPSEVLGKTAIAEGIVYALETETNTSCSEVHNSKETKSEKEEGCCSNKKVTKVYQLKGLGVKIN